MMFDFYSRPCGRGDKQHPRQRLAVNISTHAPAGGATIGAEMNEREAAFLLTPLREGRRQGFSCCRTQNRDFYSRPCGRGDEWI